MKELLIATNNPGKFLEIASVMADLPYKLVSLRDLVAGARDFSGVMEFEEDGATFEENAAKKAKFYAEKTGLMTLAEDSGILVEALKGEFGVYTRRWGAGEKASDQEWVEFFLKRMEGVVDRRAKFVCCACLVDKDGEKFFQGETSGTITGKLMAPILPGLPLSSCFLPNGCDTVYAALSHEEKNKISHRGKAMKQVREFLQKKV